MPKEFTAEELDSMFTSLNDLFFKSAEPKSPGQIPTGTYQARVETVRFEKSGKGNPYLAVDMVLLGPKEELAGTPVAWVTNFVNEMNFTIFKGHLYRVGIRNFSGFKDAVSQVAALKGATIEIYATEPKAGYQNIVPNRVLIPST